MRRCAFLIGALLLCAAVPRLAHAAARVQGCTTQNGATSSATVVCTMGAGVGGGHLVVLFVGTNVGVTGVSSVTDDKSDSCTVVDEAGGAGNYNLTSVYCPNVTAGATTFTATLSSAATLAMAFGAEFSGVLTTSPLDVHAAQTQTTPGTGANAITSGSVTTTHANELIVGGTVNRSGAAGAGTITIGTGFTLGQSVANTLTSEYQVQAAAGSIAATFKASSASDSFDTAVMTFLPSLSASQLQGYAVLTATGPSASQLQGYAVLAQGMNAAQLQGYAVLTQALNVAQLQGYAVLCPNPGVGACPAGPTPPGSPQVAPWFPAGSTMTR